MAKSKKKTQEEIYLERRNECVANFKIFKRFLKENGCYHKIMKYLFPSGRSYNDFIDSWIKICCVHNILNRTETLGPSYKEKGYMDWYINIKEISTKWNALPHENFF